ncbi:MAG TPA: inorganic diphosphatase [Gemmatimonadales bacterium]|nr:inorganic diphosphatase [Gemmatimonadales bacterium]
MARLPGPFAENGAINVMVESPRGSAVKLKYDPKHQLISLSRPLTAGLSFPFDWGFVTGTKASDGDPLDAFVLWDVSSYPGVVIPCRPLGVLNVEQTNKETQKRERNDRIAVVPLKAPRQESLRSVLELTERARAEIETFFLEVVAFEGKDLKLLGWQGPDAALKRIRAGAAARKRGR